MSDERERHECEQMRQAILDSICDSLLWGDAISDIRHVSGRWIAENGEYGTYIMFCPFCGEKLPEIEPPRD